MALVQRAPRKHPSSHADSRVVGASRSSPGWAVDVESVGRIRNGRSELAHGRRARSRSSSLGNVSWRAVRKSGEPTIQGQASDVAEGRACARVVSEDARRDRPEANRLGPATRPSVAMLRATVKFLLLTEAFAVATFAFGWWAVPLLAFAWAAFVDTKRPVMFATLC